MSNIEVGRVFAPHGLLCEKCERPLAFRLLPSGKWCPCDPDGSDHWDGCKEVQRKEMGILNADGTVNWDALKRYDPPRTVKPKRGITHFYCGAVPPWDESLGNFRDFTTAEKAGGEVCAP